MGTEYSLCTHPLLPPPPVMAANVVHTATHTVIVHPPNNSMEEDDFNDDVLIDGEVERVPPLLVESTRGNVQNITDDASLIIYSLNTQPYLSRYEKTAVISFRAHQLADNYPSLLPVKLCPKRRLGDEIRIAELELKGGYLREYQIFRPALATQPSRRIGYIVTVGRLKIKRD